MTTSSSRLISIGFLMALVIVASSLIAACCMPDCDQDEPSPTPIPLLEVVDSEGREVVIDVPDGVVPDGLTLVVEGLTSPGTEPFEDNATFIGSAFDLSLVDETGTAVTSELSTFDQPLMITITYLREDAATFNQDTFKLYYVVPGNEVYWDSAGSCETSDWLGQDGYVRDSKTMQIRLNVCHLTRFALAGAIAE